MSGILGRGVEEVAWKMDIGMAWARTVLCPDPAHGLGSRAASGSKSLTSSVSPRWQGRSPRGRPCPEGLVVSSGTLMSPRRRLGTNALGRLICAVFSARSGRRGTSGPLARKRGEGTGKDHAAVSPPACTAVQASVLQYQPPPDECSSRASLGGSRILFFPPRTSAIISTHDKSLRSRICAHGLARVRVCSSGKSARTGGGPGACAQGGSPGAQAGAGGRGPGRSGG
jgi:hypothetical protein